ncbi:hypothetical protein [Streptomyces sp. H51]|uniref:Rv1733c family protein n=1 Tax=Streptomyces sp. H51 TaxID=3111770 RepID=UPI002D785791|nr:hypothetical protein [Streptomyces sp. H51]
MALRGPKVWLWRWRRNPLRRRADVVEAWAVLGTWALTVLAGVLAGLTATGSVEDGLARERAEWRPVVARLAEKAPGAAPAHPGAANPEQVWGKARWTAPDGSVHTGRVRVRPGSAAGGTVGVWTDAQGRLVAEPATVSQARLRASLIGTLVGVSAAMAPLACGRVLRGRLERRRLDRWDAEWARFGPLWGRKTS